jgi:hypothetical protein
MPCAEAKVTIAIVNKLSWLKQHTGYKEVEKRPGLCRLVWNRR